MDGERKPDGEGRRRWISLGCGEVKMVSLTGRKFAAGGFHGGRPTNGGLSCHCAQRGSPYRRQPLNAVHLDSSSPRN